MIKKYSEWITENVSSEKFPMIELDTENGEILFPVLPNDIWLELGNIILEKISAHFEKNNERRDLATLINYLVYRTIEDQGRTKGDPFVDSVQSKSRGDGKNILSSGSPVKFSHVIGISTRSNEEEVLNIFYREGVKFASEKNLIFSDDEFLYLGMRNILLYPKNWKGALVGKKFGL